MNEQVETSASVGPPGFFDVFLANAPDNYEPALTRSEAVTQNFTIEFQYAVYDDDGNLLSPAVVDPNTYRCIRVRSEARAREFETLPFCIGCISAGEVIWGTIPKDADDEYVSPFM